MFTPSSWLPNSWSTYFNKIKLPKVNSSLVYIYAYKKLANIGNSLNKSWPISSQQKFKKILLSRNLNYLWPKSKVKRWIVGIFAYLLLWIPSSFESIRYTFPIAGFSWCQNVKISRRFMSGLELEILKRHNRSLAHKVFQFTFRGGVNSRGVRECDTKPDKTVLFAGQMTLFAGQKWYQRPLPQLKLSAHSGVDYLSFCVLAWKFTCSVRLHYHCYYYYQFIYSKLTFS